MQLSICIPTFSRAFYLERLLQNILQEDTSEVELIIIDDGSTDRTEDVILKYSQLLNIKYESQKNAGRSNALRRAIELASGTYTMIMDDEDLFVINAFSSIKKHLLHLPTFCNDSREIIGLSFLTKDVSGNIIGKKFPTSPMVSNLVAINADFRNTGDKKQIVKTSEIKKVLYDTFPGERRMPTYVLWARIARNFDIYLINEVIVIKEYLETGLSKNINIVRQKSPQSSRLIYQELLEMPNEIYKSERYRLKNAINFYRYNFHCEKQEIPKTAFFYKIVGILMGFLLYKQDTFITKK